MTNEPICSANQTSPRSQRPSATCPAPGRTNDTKKNKSLATGASYQARPQPLAQVAVAGVVVGALVPQDPEGEAGHEHRRLDGDERAVAGELGRDARGEREHEVAVAEEPRRDEEVGHRDGDAAMLALRLEVVVDPAPRPAARRDEDVRVGEVAGQGHPLPRQRMAGAHQTDELLVEEPPLV